MRRFGCYLALLLGLGGPLLAHGQAQDLQFEHLTVDDGLSLNHVHTVFQDRQGFIWLGTQDGLDRYDGRRIVTYHHNPLDTTSISNNDVFALYEDPQGDLWVGTFDGLNRWGRATGRFSRYRHDAEDPNSLSAGRVLALVEDPDDATILWVGTDGGLDRLERTTGRITHYRHDAEDPNSLSDNRVYAIAVSPEGRLWLGTEAGLNHLDRRTGAVIRYHHDPDDPESLAGAWIRALCVDKQGRLWIGLENDGLDQFNPATETFIHFRHDPGDLRSLRGDRVMTLLEDRRGVLWVGTGPPGTLHRYDPDAGAFVRFFHDSRQPGSISAGSVTGLFEDRQGVFWATTFGGGVNRFDPNIGRFPHFRHDPDDPTSLSQNVVLTVYEAPSEPGIFWVGTAGGLNRLDRSTGVFTHYRHDPRNPNSLTNDFVLSVAEDAEGWLWVGGVEGLNRLDRATGRVTRYRHDPNDPHSLSSNELRAMIVDGQGVLWIGTIGGGLNRLDPETEQFTHYRHDPEDPTSLGDDAVSALYEDRDGVLWLGTFGGGLNRFDRRTETFTRYQHNPQDPQSLSFDAVVAIQEDPTDPDVLWLGTFGGGLNRFDRQSETFTTFAEHNSDLPNNIVYAILPDAVGHFWITTNKGLSRFDPQTGTFRNYGATRGVQSNEFNVGAYFKSHRGALFFGGVNGFNAFFPKAITDNPYPPQVALTDFKRLNESVIPGPEAPLAKAALVAEVITLSHNDKAVSFEFAALHFSRPEQNQYAYQMVGFDDAWRDGGLQGTATYTNLDPGSYTFLAKAANADGVWSEADVAVRVVVHPPWWQTWWFRIGALLLVMGLAAAGYGMRVRQLKQREQELNTLVQQRTKDLVAEKKKTEEQAEKLRELDRLKSRFFANVSHEFRTPLTLTIGPLEDLRDEYHSVLGEDGTQQVDLALRNARRVLALINELLETAKLEAGRIHLKASKADLVAFVQDQAQAFIPLAERKQITFAVEAPSEVIAVYFDATQLEKVFTNLLSNAFKFTPEGGAIRVEMERESEEAIAVAIRDNGPGIPVDQLQHIFERFHQVDESALRLQPGTGIGLALAKDLVDLHGGTITAESIEGFGSTFSLAPYSS